MTVLYAELLTSLLLDDCDGGILRDLLLASEHANYVAIFDKI